MEIGAVALDARLRRHANLQEDVARRPAQLARMTLTAHPDPLPVGDPGGDLDLERPVLQRPPDPVAGGARRLDGATGALAAGAGARADELAEHALRDLLHATRSAADVARHRRAAGLGTVAAARLARPGDADRRGHGDAGEGLGERDLGADGDVATAARAAAARGLTEERLAEEGTEDVREVPEVEVRRREAASAQALVTEPVVGRPAVGIGEHLVGLGRLAEALLRVGRGRDIGMDLARELPEGALDVGVARVAPDPENLVVVPLCRGHLVFRG